MRVWLSTSLILLALVDLCLVRQINGQDPPAENGRDEPAAPDATPNAGTQPNVERSPLTTYYLRDKDGNLKPYFAIPFEEWDEIYKLYLGISEPDRPPRFILQDVSISGSVAGDLATLNCTLQIFTKADGWVRVPLGLNDFILRKSSFRPTATQALIEYDKGGDGYICRLQGTQNQTHRVELTMLAKVQRVGDRNQISFTLKQPSTSRLELSVQGQSIDVFLDGNGVATTQSAGNDKTKLVVDGLGGEVRIAWQPKKTPSKTAQPLFKATSEVLVTIDGQRLVYQVQLQVSSFRTPFDSFLVRVPRGPAVKQLADDQRGYRITVLPEDDPRVARFAGDSQLVEIRLTQKTLSTENILLLAEMSRPRNGNTRLPIRGIEIPHAILHSGEFHLAVRQADATVHWEGESRLTQLEDIPDRLRRLGVVTRFAYGSEPWSMQVSVADKPKTVRIEPAYYFLVEAEQVVLSARLVCHLAGSDTKTVNVDLPGWTVDTIGPSQWVDADKLNRDEVAPLKIPITVAAQSSAEPINLQIQAHRVIDPADAPLTIPIPQATENTSVQATVIVATSGNVRLTPDAERMSGLTSISVPTSIPLPAAWTAGQRQRPLLAYRAHGSIEDATFAGQLSRLEQKVSVELDGTVQLSRQQATIEQNLKLQIENEPLRHLLLSVPGEVVEGGELTIHLREQELDWIEQPNDGATNPANRQNIEVDLAEDRLGEVNLTLQFEQPLPNLVVGRRVPVSIQLVTPVDTGWRMEEIQLQVARDLRIESDEDWKMTRQQSAEVEAQPTLQLSKAGGVPQAIPLHVTHIDPPKKGTIVVEKLWLCSWLSQSGRQDRAVFQIATKEKQLEVQLPTGAAIDDIALDGQRITDRTAADQGRLTIPLGDDQRTVVMELWYSFADGRPPLGSISLAAPRIAATRWTRRTYWQVILPPDEHLLTGPQRMTPELTWRWQRLYWGRRATLTQHDLENWIGASHQADLPTATNQYLFSSFGSIPQIEIHTVARRTILLTIPLAVFVLGMLLIYVPALRHPVALLALGLFVVAVGLLYPEPALQVAQVATVGLVFVLSMRALKWLFARPRHSPAVIRGAASHTDLASTQVRITPSSTGGSAPSSTSALSIHLSESESKA